MVGIDPLSRPTAWNIDGRAVLFASWPGPAMTIGRGPCSPTPLILIRIGTCPGYLPATLEARKAGISPGDDGGSATLFPPAPRSWCAWNPFPPPDITCG